MPPSEPAGKVQGENSIVNSWYFRQPEMIFFRHPEVSTQCSDNWTRDVKHKAQGPKTGPLGSSIRST